MRLWFAILLLPLAIVAGENIASDTLKFVTEAQSKLKLSTNPEIILVIGNTGSGKSTLVHYVASDFSKIISKEPENPNSSDFEIQDGLDLESGIVKLSTVSRTFVPEMIVDEEQNVWYDCPGFHDTRNETIEIATTFLIRSVIESASSVKLVLVVDYESVTKSHSRSDFDELLSRATELLKRVNKFENSVSLVVTKVPSFKLRGRQNIEISENSVKNTSAEFISEHRSVLLGKGINEKKILLIDALLLNSNNDYPRISVFWRPGDLGPFSNISKLTTGRHFIRKSILKNTIYTQIQTDDFGFPLSAEAKLHIRIMVDQLIENISTKLSSVTDRLQNDLDKRIDSETSFKLKLDRIELARYRLQYPTQNVPISLKNVTHRFHGIIEGSDLRSIDNDELTQIQRDEKNLNTLDSLSKDATTNDNLQSPKIDYKSCLNKINEFFKKSEDQIQKDIVDQAQKTIQNIYNAVTNIDTRFVTTLEEKLKLMNGFKDKVEMLKLAKLSIQQIGDATTIDQRMRQFATLIYKLKITSIDVNECNRTVQLALDLEELKSLSISKIIVPIRDWIASSKSTISFISSEFVWYSFLPRVYDFLSSYEVQKNTEVYKPRGQLITSENFKEFTSRIKSTMEFKPTLMRLNEVNEIIATTIISPPKYTCTDEIITIERNFLRSSDIQLSNCPSIKKLKRLNVFVVDRFYVDADINLNGIENLELHILANDWIIVQPATFRLNGFNGVSHAPLSINGMAGKSGNPGMNSGNFFGVANKVENGGSLTVELIGGNGGDGQDGTGSQDTQVIHNEEDCFDKNKPLYVPYICDNSASDCRTFFKFRVCQKYPAGTRVESPKVESGTISKMLDVTNLNYLTNFDIGEASIGREITLSWKVFTGDCCGTTGVGGRGKLN